MWTLISKQKNKQITILKGNNKKPTLLVTTYRISKLK